MKAIHAYSRQRSTTWRTNHGSERPLHELEYPPNFQHGGLLARRGPPLHLVPSLFEIGRGTLSAREISGTSGRAVLASMAYFGE